MTQRRGTFLPAPLLSVVLAGAWGCTTKADLAERAFKARDYPTALKLARPQAERGNVRMQNLLGRMLSQGLGAAADPAEAALWFRKAAEQGDEWAAIDLGWLCLHGRGVPEDGASALKWFRVAADKGNEAAQKLVGDCYNYGRCAKADSAEAVRWYRKAVDHEYTPFDKGYAPAQLSLGRMLDNGWGVARSTAEAALWYRKAAEQGNVSAAQLDSLRDRLPPKPWASREPLAPGARQNTPEETAFLQFAYYAANKEVNAQIKPRGLCRVHSATPRGEAWLKAHYPRDASRRRHLMTIPKTGVFYVPFLSPGPDRPPGRQAMSVILEGRYLMASSDGGVVYLDLTAAPSSMRGFPTAGSVRAGSDGERRIEGMQVRDRALVRHALREAGFDDAEAAKALFNLDEAGKAGGHADRHRQGKPKSSSPEARRSLRTGS